MHIIEYECVILVSCPDSLSQVEKESGEFSFGFQCMTNCHYSHQNFNTQLSFTPCLAELQVHLAYSKRMGSRIDHWLNASQIIVKALSFQVCTVIFHLPCHTKYFLGLDIYDSSISSMHDPLPYYGKFLRAVR